MDQSSPKDRPRNIADEAAAEVVLGASLLAASEPPREEGGLRRIIRKRLEEVIAEEACAERLRAVVRGLRRERARLRAPRETFAPPEWSAYLPERRYLANHDTDGKLREFADKRRADMEAAEADLEEGQTSSPAMLRFLRRTELDDRRREERTRRELKALRRQLSSLRRKVTRSRVERAVKSRFIPAFYQGRESAPAPARTRGSRRVVSSCSGRGDPDPEPEPGSSGTTKQRRPNCGSRGRR